MKIVITALIAILLSCHAAHSQDPELVKKAKQEIGRRFFFDGSVQSLTGKLSCSTCHDPDPKFGYSNGHEIAVGAQGYDPRAPLGVMGIHNTKSLLGCSRLLRKPCDADGRAPNLNAACLQAVTDPLVLGMPSLDAVTQRMSNGKEYRDLAKIAYAPYEGVFNEFMLRDSLLHFLVLLDYNNLPADRMAVGLEVDVPESCKRGEKLFMQWCAGCHKPENHWTDDDYHNIGWNYRNNIVIQGNQLQVKIVDKVRSTVTNNPADDCKVLTPSLRGIVHTAPYFLDGKAKTIREVLEYKASGGRFVINGVTYNDPNRDDLIKVIAITKAGIDDLTDYLELCFQDPEHYPLFTDPSKKGLVTK